MRLLAAGWEPARARTVGAAAGAEQVEIDVEALEAAQRMALHALGCAFDRAREGRDWFAMSRELGRVRDAVQAVWYAARVRDDGAP